MRDYRPSQAPPSLAWISVSSGTRESTQPAEAGQQAAASQQEAPGAGQRASLAVSEAMRAQSYEARQRLQLLVAQQSAPQAHGNAQASLPPAVLSLPLRDCCCITVAMFCCYCILQERHSGALQDWEIECQLGSPSGQTAQQVPAGRRLPLRCP